MKMKLMRRIDFLLGVPICYALAAMRAIKRSLPFKREAQDEIRKVLVIKFLGIGSITLTTPALMALKDEFPGARIYYLTFESNKEVLELLGLTHKNYYIDVKTILGFFLSALKTIFALRKEKIDLMLDFEFFSKLPIIISAVSRIRHKAGFYLINEWWRKNLLDSCGYYNHYYHVKDIFLSLVYLVRYKDPYYIEFGAYQKKYTLPVSSPSPSTLKRARGIMESAGIPSDNLFVVINPNAGPELAPNLKRWPAEYFAELMNRLQGKYAKSISIAIIGSPAEREYAQSIADCVKERGSVVNIAGRTTLTELVGLLSLSDLFITVDSGPMHLASLARTPTIGLFGAETPVLYGPLNEHATVLCAELYSVPMFTVYGGKESGLAKNVPLQRIGVDEVFKTAEKYLNEKYITCTASFAKHLISNKSE